MCDQCHEYHKTTEETLRMLGKQHALASDERAEIRNRLAELAEAHEHHVDEVHANLVSRQLTPLERSVKEIAGALMGPERTPLEGGGRHTEAGLVTRVERLSEAQLQSLAEIAALRQGEVKASLTVGQWLMLIIAGIGGGATIISALISAT